MASIGARVAHGALRVLNLEAFVQAKLAEGVCALQHVRVVQGGQADTTKQVMEAASRKSWAARVAHERTKWGTPTLSREQGVSS